MPPLRSCPDGRGRCPGWWILPHALGAVAVAGETRPPLLRTLPAPDRPGPGDTTQMHVQAPDAGPVRTLAPPARSPPLDAGAERGQRRPRRRTRILRTWIPQPKLRA